MAVYDNYIEPNILAGAGRLTSGLTSQGVRTVKQILRFDTVAAWDALSIVRIFRAMPNTAVPVSLSIATDGVTGATSVDVGLYKVGAGKAVVDVDCLAADVDLQTATTFATAMGGIGNGLGALTTATYGKSLWEIAGESLTDRESAYDVALTFNDITEADQVVVIAEWAFA